MMNRLVLASAAALALIGGAIMVQPVMALVPQHSVAVAVNPALSTPKTKVKAFFKQNASNECQLKATADNVVRGSTVTISVTGGSGTNMLAAGVVTKTATFGTVNFTFDNVPCVAGTDVTSVALN